MTFDASIAAMPPASLAQGQRERIVARIALAALACAFLFGLARLGVHAAFALGYSYGLDYGEGTVWEQMRGIVAGAGYAPLRLLPGFVYEYPPLYHGVVAAVARLFDLDPLRAGRLVSLISAGGCAALVAGLTAAMIGRTTSTGTRRTAAIVAALSFATLPVVLSWSLLMRVDMLACVLTLAGMVLAVRAAERPAFAIWAGLAFTAALYTRQTCLPAPAAAWIVLMAVRPRAAWAMLATSLASGLAALAMLEIATGGQFLVHILLYNVNRVIWAHGVQLLLVLAASSVTLALGAIGGAAAARRLRLGDRRTLRTRVAADRALVAIAIVLLTLALKTVMLPAILKSGASDNYLIDWFACIAVLIGAAAAPVIGVARGERSRSGLAVALLLGIGVPAQMIAPALRPTAPADPTATARLVERIRASAKPVVSDDMVLLLRAGQGVPWEPAIIAELGAAGVYDERALARRVRRGDFGFFVTSGDRGSRLFDERFNPVIADAMATAYPRRAHVGALTLHLPR